MCAVGRGDWRVLLTLRAGGSVNRDLLAPLCELVKLSDEIYVVGILKSSVSRKDLNVDQNNSISFLIYQANDGAELSAPRLTQSGRVPALVRCYSHIDSIVWMDS